ncbi:MAG: 3-phosphoshikimate 1-carboxyvinyltransferase [Planctomycetes bacterium]|nr:3-phosphoshikimate 1-carboxyvinyltransferase [Planctomycetota bacterium]MBM4057629.1 3-phosphoshikimate 1-carboxyvinyltransferase [Planctomycetota bacterium]
MLDPLPVPTPAGPVVGTIRPPGSKSITNRAFVCAALARGTSRLSGILDSQDTRVMAAALGALGFAVDADWTAGTATIAGSAGRIPRHEATLDCAASGTTMRFLAAVCGLGHGVYRLDGTQRMRQRPIGDLLAALRELGVDAVAESPGECPPVTIRSRGLEGGSATVRGSASSQFASGLAMAAACSRSGLQLEFAGTLVSLPYLEMTRRVMAGFGGRCDLVGDRAWSIPPLGYSAADYAVEPDASAASYFLAAAALTGGAATVLGLSRRSMQGDVAFCDALERMGCRVEWRESVTGRDDAVTVSGRAIAGIDVDMNAISDTVPTLAVVALFADSPTTIRNVAHIRDKETDRIGDLVRELRRLGGDVEEHADGLTLVPGPLSPAALDTYDDHRMAMSLALAGLRLAGVRIRDPGCVAKTVPDYWRRLGEFVGFPPGWADGC